MPADLQSLLVFGGTFDPPHRGHIELVQAAAQQLGSTHTIIIPTRCSPHKMNQTKQTDGEHRFNMVKLAFMNAANISVSRIEIDRPGPSFAIETLESLRQAIGPTVEIRLLIGMDQAHAFEEWHQWQRILDLATPAVLPRSSSKCANEMGDLLDNVIQPDWVLRDLPLIAVSSTTIRHFFAQSPRVSECDESAGDVLASVPSQVVAYIKSHNLY